MSNKSIYFDIENCQNGFNVINLVTGMPVYEKSEKDETENDCDNEIKVFNTFNEALTTGREIAQRYRNL